MKSIALSNDFIRRRFYIAAACFSGLLIIIGVSVFFGWYIDSTFLKSIFPGIVPMNPCTSICFILTGIATLIINVEKNKEKESWLRYLVVAIAATVFVFGFVRLLGLLNIVDLKLDMIFFRQEMIREATSFSNNRIAPNTSFNLMLLGIALVLAYRRTYKPAVQSISLAIFFIGLFAIFGYAYSVKGLYGFFKYTPMALNTAVTFCIASLSLLFLSSDKGFMRYVTSAGTSGIIARRLIPAIIFVPSLLGWLRIYGDHAHLFPSEFGTALFVICMLIFFVLLVFALIQRIDDVDVGREKAEAENDRVNISLGQANALLDSRLREFEVSNQRLEDTKRAMLNLLEDLNSEKKNIQEARSKDEALLGSIGDAVFAIDTAGIIILFNPVAEQISGWSKNEAIGKRYNQVLQFASAENSEINHSFIETALLGQKAAMDAHTVLISKSGTKIPVADSASPVIDSQGKVTGAVVVFRDVTHEEQIDKAKTEFVSLASHQLRTPLSAIGWYTELLVGGDAGKITQQQKEFLDQIAESNARMVDLVNSLLNVSRIELGTLASDPVKTDILELSESVLRELIPQIAETKLRINKTYPPEGLSLVVDPKLMRIIIQNLLSNAVKYSRPEGQITIAFNLDKHMMHLSVSDSGLGIPKAEQGKIFTKLFRADNAKENVADGNGLGLYIVKSIIDSQQGSIRFESEENRGTTFFVELPAGGMKKIEGSKTLS